MEDQKKMKEQIQAFNQSKSNLPATIPFTLLADEADVLSVYRLLPAGAKSSIYASLYRLLDKEAKYTTDAELVACDDYLFLATDDAETIQLAQSADVGLLQAVIARVRRDFAVAELYAVSDQSPSPVFAGCIEGEQEVSTLCLIITLNIGALPQERFESMQEMGRKYIADIEALGRPEDRQTTESEKDDCIAGN